MLGLTQTLEQLWPFRVPLPPSDSSANLLRGVRAILEAAYWSGVRDGATMAAVGLILAYILLTLIGSWNRPPRDPRSTDDGQ